VVTVNPIPIPSVAPRGSVQKTFVPAKVLSGFTDPSHFGLLADEYLASLGAEEKKRVLDEAEASRTFIRELPPFVPSSIIIRDIVSPHVNAIRAEPLFGQLFGRTPHRFCYVNPSGIIALQAWIEPRSDSVPTEESALLEFALPRTWDIPVEVSFIPPEGPIQILSSNPAFQGLAMEMDQATSRVMLSAPKHLNLVQVVHFNGRFFLRNGYHRVSDALNAGVIELPAVVIDAFNPNEIAIPGVGTFNIGYVLNLPRPPLVRDFHTKAAIVTKVRERRYGVIVSLDVKPLVIGI